MIITPLWNEARNYSFGQGFVNRASNNGSVCQNGNTGAKKHFTQALFCLKNLPDRRLEVAKYRVSYLQLQL
jgi:hypothetical protein